MDESTSVQVTCHSVELLAGGTDTSVNALAYCFLLLAEHQDCQQRVFDEVQRVIGRFAVVVDSQSNSLYFLYVGNEQLSSKHIAELRYTEQVLRETLRMQPVVPYLLRVNIAADTIGGMYFPPKQPVIAVLHHPVAFAKPARFDPEPSVPL